MTPYDEFLINLAPSFGDVMGMVSAGLLAILALVVVFGGGK